MSTFNPTHEEVTHSISIISQLHSVHVSDIMFIMMEVKAIYQVK